MVIESAVRQIRKKRHIVASIFRSKEMCTIQYIGEATFGRGDSFGVLSLGLLKNKHNFCVEDAGNQQVNVYFIPFEG